MYGSLLASVGVTNKLSKTPAEKEISDIEFNHMKMGAETPVQRKRYDEFRDLRDAYMTGDLNTISDVTRKARADGIVISRDQLKQIQLSRDTSPLAKSKLLEHKMKQFTPEEVLNVWGKMDDEEKPLYEKFVLHKIARSRTMTIQEKREAIASLRQ